MRPMKYERKQAYQSLMELIDKSEKAARIRGTKYSREANDRFSEIAQLCITLFSSLPTSAKIVVDEVKQSRSFTNVTIYIDAFELNTANKADFFKLVNLSDSVIFYGDKDDLFHITFSVNDIWTE